MLELPAFDYKFASNESTVTAEQGVEFRSSITISEAYECLNEFEVLIVLGGSAETILSQCAEPIGICKAFAHLGSARGDRTRTLLSICTGSLFLAEAGVLAGLHATTHRDFLGRLESLCQRSADRDASDPPRVVKARYVVNDGMPGINDSSLAFVITSAGVASGIDATLHMVSILVGYEAAERAADYMEYDWKQGIVVKSHGKSPD